MIAMQKNLSCTTFHAYQKDVLRMREVRCEYAQQFFIQKFDNNFKLLLSLNVPSLTAFLI